MSHKFYAKSDIHGGGVLAFLIALAVAFLIANNTAFANEESDKHNAKGVEYFSNAKNSQDYQNALKEFEAAIKIDGNSATYYSNRGSTYFKLNNYEAALKDLNKAIQLN